MSGRRPGDSSSVTSRVLAILGCFSPGDPRLSLAEISRRTGLAASTAHRLVGELCAWGALERDQYGVYRIGTRLRELTRQPSEPVTVRPGPGGREVVA